MSPPRSVDPRHASAVTQGTRESLSATALPPLQLRPAGSRAQRSRLAPSAAVPKFAHGRSLIHTALSSSRRSGAAPTHRGSRARVVTSVPARPCPGGSPVRPQLSRGSQSRPPFCFRGRDGRGSTTGAAFARSSSPEPLRGPGVTRTVKTTSPARALDLVVMAKKDIMQHWGVPEVPFIHEWRQGMDLFMAAEKVTYRNQNLYPRGSTTSKERST
ncbi:hypothetical protein NDU88_002193 [Pleurodeles waltl]|uniref:Uncharacterized protein n=1 Tax=Pleurodeles waltl TaxID=8319 RepID=A0AAV7NLB4_PLEWA|nr:hypothetical protein NDU88_002193 [Pleurodeles waltl]